LRPPRSSVSSAYLNHLSRKKLAPSSPPEAEMPESSSSRSKDAAFPGPVDKPSSSISDHVRVSSVFTRPPALFFTESSGTALTCLSDHSASTERTDSSVRERVNTEDDDAAWDLDRDLSTALVLVDSPVDELATKGTAEIDELFDQLMVQGNLDGYELGSGSFDGRTVPDDHDDDDYNDHQDDDDSLTILTRLVDETSRRWERNTMLTHQEFCRFPNCGICLAQSEGIIAQQQAEIQALRAKLHEKEVRTEPQHCDDDIIDTEHVDYLPIEQIEVYHGDDDCNVSVTSGLTNLYPDHHSTMMMDGADAQSLHRPDAESAAANHLPSALPPPHPQQQPLRVRSHTVSLTAADGSVRQAIYSGPMSLGKPHGVGVLKFETGDIYLGDLRQGCMHGQGTYTFKESKSKHRKNQVLKGTFQNNVFTGHDPNAELQRY
jgi:hypothetical protein